MQIVHQGKSPRIDPEAYIAPNAVICGDVEIGPGCRVMFGAQIVAEGGRISLGRECIVMENAVLRSSALHDLHIGDNCLIGPNAHLVGCTIENQVFVATGAAIFHGAHVESGCEVRINGVVHLKTRLPAGETVPIGWVAVGDPPAILPAEAHEAIWERQKPLNFPLTAYGIDRTEADMVKITQYMVKTLAGHREDHIVDEGKK